MRDLYWLRDEQISDDIAAAVLLDERPKVQWLLADRGYEADGFRNALEEKGIKPCIPGRKSRNAPVKNDKRRYRRRNRIEILFGRLKDWRRPHATPLPDRILLRHCARRHRHPLALINES